MDYLEEVDYSQPDFGDIFDELPLWSAPFGLLLLEHVPLKRGMTILDVGAGTGFLSIELAQRCGTDTQLIALDPWETAIIRLRRKLDALSLTNIRLLQQDAAEMDLPSNSIDLIVSNLGINNFKQPEKVLANCYRVLKKNSLPLRRDRRDGGRFLFTTNLVGHMQEFYDQFQATLVELGLTDQVAALDDHINHRATIESVSQLVAQAGFNLTNIYTNQFHMRFADGSAFLRHFFIRLAFLLSWKFIVPPEIASDVFKNLEERLNNFASKQGELSLTIPMACFEAQK